jgi:kumamolisin
VALALLFMCSTASAETINAIIKLRERVPLEQLANDVRSPDSPRFGQYYSNEEIQKISGPSAVEYSQLIAQLKLEGIQVTKETKTHLWISVRAESSTLARVFRTQFTHDEKGNRKSLYAAKAPFYMNVIESVGGLNSSRKAHPLFKRSPASAFDPTQAAPAPPTWPGGVAPTTIKTVYGFDALYKAGLTGKGQHIAIATYNTFDVNDVKAYYAALKLKTTASIDQVAFNGVAPVDENSAVETQLDAEMSGMIAPGASIHVFASATNDDAGELQMFTAILDDGRAKVVNYSWGSCESQVDPQHALDITKVFAQAVAQGVNILVASGDSGSDSCQNGTTAADWPAAHPDVVAVGGTTLKVSGNKASETAWSGSGGGVSSLFTLPLWQQSFQAPYVRRSYPDVAFNADPASGEAIIAHQNGKAGWFVVGGTSMAAPQWAGFLALVGEARALRKLAPLGFLNPLIYRMSAAAKKSGFNDVSSGSNGAYSAGVSWDAVTGLGSMHGQGLLKALALK